MDANPAAVVYRAEVRSSPFLRYAVPVGAACFGATAVTLVVRDALPLSWPLAGLAAMTLLMVFFSAQFDALALEIREDAVSLGFGRIRRTVPRSRIVSASAAEIRFFDAWGLGVRRSFLGRTEYWLPRFGPAVSLALEDGRHLVFSAERPDEALRALTPA